MRMDHGGSSWRQPPARGHGPWGDGLAVELSLMVFVVVRQGGWQRLAPDQGLQGRLRVLLRGGDDLHAIASETMGETFATTGGNKLVERENRVIAALVFVQGHVLRQIQSFRLAPDAVFVHLVDKKAPGLSRMTGDGSEILTGDADFHGNSAAAETKKGFPVAGDTRGKPGSGWLPTGVDPGAHAYLGHRGRRLGRKLSLTVSGDRT
jgi:hypothetical protein